MGDWNADPLNEKAANLAIVNDLLDRLTNFTVVPKGHDGAYTRPNSRSHIDNFIARKKTLSLTSGNLEYYPNNNIGCIRGGRKKPSDHLPISLDLKVSRSSEKRPEKKKVTHWDTKPLREGKSNYPEVLSTQVTTMDAVEKKVDRRVARPT